MFKKKEQEKKPFGNKEKNKENIKNPTKRFSLFADKFS